MKIMIDWKGAAMGNYQRFQTLSAGAQNRFDPDSPVWVSRYQLSLDLESEKRLLQARLVNVSDKRIRQVFLRIKCMDSRSQQLAMLEMVPLPALLALPGRIFGDDKIVEITPAGTTFLEVYAQRVVFTDGTSWNESAAGQYIAFAAPVPVKAGDEAYQRLKDRAAAGGVRNSYYFHTQKGLWTCTCGQPNGSGSLRCAHCGADRLWLEKNMDPEGPQPAQEPQPEPAPVHPQEPAPMVMPIMPVIQPSVPAAPAAPNPYPGLEGRMTPRPAYTPDPEEVQKQRHPGRVTVIMLSILVVLLIGGWCVYRFLMPELRYQKAAREQSAGNYDKAEEIYEGLDGYKDSPERIISVKLAKIRAVMSEGDYLQAMELLEEVKDRPEYDSYMADCLYSLGVLAFNDKDVDSAWSYVQRLEAQYPDYAKLPQLRQYCRFSFGNRIAAEAAEKEDPEERIYAYESAIREFEQAEDYADSADRITECRYRIAVEKMNLDRLTEAVDAFAELEDYKQSVEYRNSCMYRYAWQHLEDVDELSITYLEALSRDGYPGAQALLDRYTGRAFVFRVSVGADPNAPAAVTVTDLGEVYISYQVESSDQEGAVPVLAVYQLPDGRQGRGMLNNDRSASGTVAWSALFPTDCTVSGEVSLAFYDSQRGEMESLSAVSFQYEYTPPEPEPTEPSEEPPVILPEG